MGIRYYCICFGVGLLCWISTAGSVTKSTSPAKDASVHAVKTTVVDSDKPQPTSATTTVAPSSAPPTTAVPSSTTPTTSVPTTTQTSSAPTTAPTIPASNPSDNSPISNSNAPAVIYIGDPNAGLSKSGVCSACHGVDGNSSVPAWPKIAEQGEAYLIKELIEYRKGDKGTRFDPSMFAMTQALSDNDIADLAAYFAGQKMSPGSAKADLVALGEKLYRGGNPDTGVPACSACHGATGEGNVLARYPRLSGQHADYTLDQLKKFKAKTRSDDPNGIMRDISQRMTDEEMKAVSSYVSGLH